MGGGLKVSPADAGGVELVSVEVGPALDVGPALGDPGGVEGLATAAQPVIAADSVMAVARSLRRRCIDPVDEVDDRMAG